MADSAKADWVEDEYFFDEDLGVFVLTEDQAFDRFDREARKVLGISGEEFLRRWDNGEIPPVPDTPEGRPLGHLVMMIPFGRREKA